MTCSARQTTLAPLQPGWDTGPARGRAMNGNRDDGLTAKDGACADERPEHGDRRNLARRLRAHDQPLGHPRLSAPGGRRGPTRVDLPLRLFDLPADLLGAPPLRFAR